MSVASKRRQGGKVETHSERDSGRESAEVEEAVIAVVGGERNQEQQGTSSKGCPSLTIQQPRGRHGIELPWWKAFNICNHRSELAKAPTK